MSYVQSNLLNNEQVVLRTRPHRTIYCLPVLMIVLLLFVAQTQPAFQGIQRMLGGLLPWRTEHGFSWAALILGAVYLSQLWTMRNFSEYGITNRRLIMKTGIFRRRTMELFLEKVEAIKVDQSLWARLCGYGTVVVIGTGGSKDAFDFVPAPLSFRRCAQQQIEQALQRVDSRRQGT